MLNKRKIIILGIVTLFFAVVLIFAFKIKDKDTEGNKNRSKEAENSENKATKDETSAKLEELKNNRPELSASQLEFYLLTAKSNKEIKKRCEGRNDENDCIALVAFINGESAICGEIENLKIRIECANTILQRLATEKIDECWSFNGYDLMHCLRNVFVIYDKPEDCLNLKSEKMQRLCKSIFYYETAFLQYDRESCKKITDERLNQYCYESIIDKSLDSDNDGLTDYEEILTYKTNPNNKDTDGDKYLDGEEIKKGFNPLVKGG